MIELDSYSYRICVLDQLPIHESLIYSTIAYEHGVKEANRYSRRVCVKNHPPPEVKEDAAVRGHIVDMGTLAGSKRGYGDRVSTASRRGSVSTQKAKAR